jgi:hypothetical protein
MGITRTKRQAAGNQRGDRPTINGVAAIQAEHLPTVRAVFRRSRDLQCEKESRRKGKERKKNKKEKKKREEKIS